jgi:hypothetical protein
VERIIGSILTSGPRQRHLFGDILDDRQSFFLLASVWLHDAGMLVSPTDWEQQAAQRQAIPVEEWIRRNHHKRSKKYIKEHSKQLGLEDFEANIIGTICEVHREVMLTDLPDAGPNIRLLGALLRAAEVLDITRAGIPIKLLAQLWEKMDPLSRWHWIKKYCVADARLRHEVLSEDSPAPLMRLTYEYEVCLPDTRLVSPFVDRLMEPIRDVFERQHVDLILKAAGLFIAFHDFVPTPLIADPVLFGTTRLSDCLKGLLGIPAPLPSAVLACLEQLGGKNPPAAALLKRHCQRLADAAFDLPNGALFETTVVRYMDALRRASDPKAVAGAYGAFRRRIPALLKDGKYGHDQRKRIAEACLMVGWLGWRLFSFVLGDEPARRLNLVSMMYRLGPEADNLMGWTKNNDPDRSVRRLAASALATGHV